ncbi:IS4/IS5 family transposase [Candidatus Parcubacteria bacterium]|nr:MAG: IS4/IS5 family transposase [Candidatus Parcubacteria bacterium]
METPMKRSSTHRRYVCHTQPQSLDATGQAGIKPFVDYLKQQLHLPWILKGLGQKVWGYKLASLLLVLLCRPQLGANSIAALREKLMSRFLGRLFYLRWESKATPGKRHQPSVDILYDLFEKLSPQQIQRLMNNHLKRMRREGKLPKHVDVVVDSVILELSVKHLSKSRFEHIGGRTIRGKYYKGFKVYVAIDLASKVLLSIELCPIWVTDTTKLVPLIEAVRKLGLHVRSAIFDRGFWKGDNFRWLQRKHILFYTVLKQSTQEYQDLVASVHSRSPGRRRLRDGVWVTEVTPVSLPTYLKTKRLRCFVVRMRGQKPWAVITNDEQTDACWAVDFYLQRNLVEKVIQELLEDYSLAKLPRSKFDQNACWVLLTGWSYNLWLDFRMHLFGLEALDILRKKLTTLRRQIIDVPAVVRYVRKAIVLEFENPPPIMQQLLSQLE